LHFAAIINVGTNLSERNWGETFGKQASPIKPGWNGPFAGLVDVAPFVVAAANARKPFAKWVRVFELRRNYDLSRLVDESFSINHFDHRQAVMEAIGGICHSIQFAVLRLDHHPARVVNESPFTIEPVLITAD